ncbi:Retrovirus-related Pol polyprotein from transposon TNT 1-94 [Sesbania bispinosa]|nr:Retrovirus-related Pol polyprotein from transposon TNT 1-94 [Sesbania bispinosa]
MPGSLRNGETSGSEASRNMEIKEVRVQVPLTSTSTSRIVVPHVVEPHNNQEE